MRSQPGPIRPRISTMPRAKTEAAAYLDIYKLVNEKTRLQQELLAMDGKREYLVQRLAAIEREVLKLEGSAHDLRDGTMLPATGPSPTAIFTAAKVSAPTQSGSFDTLFLEY